MEAAVSAAPGSLGSGGLRVQSPGHTLGWTVSRTRLPGGLEPEANSGYSETFVWITLCQVFVSDLGGLVSINDRGFREGWGHGRGGGGGYFLVLADGHSAVIIYQHDPENYPGIQQLMINSFLNIIYSPLAQQ